MSTNHILDALYSMFMSATNQIFAIWQFCNFVGVQASKEIDAESQQMEDNAMVFVKSALRSALKLISS